MLEDCPVGSGNDLHLLFLARFIPEAQRERVARALIKKGLLDPTVYDQWLTAKQAPLVEEEKKPPSERRQRQLGMLLTHLLAFAAGFALAWVLATR